MGHNKNIPFNSPQFPLPQQAQMMMLPNFVSLPFQQPVCDPPFGGNMTSSDTAAHYLHSMSSVIMTPNTTVAITPSHSTMYTSQSRAVDTPITTPHIHYGRASQQVPLYGCPTSGPPLLLPQVS